MRAAWSTGAVTGVFTGAVTGVFTGADSRFHGWVAIVGAGIRVHD